MEVFPKLIKFLNKEYLQDFLNGNLYLKTALYYRENFDEGEGIFKYFPPGHVIKFEYGNNFEKEIFLKLSGNPLIYKKIS